MITLPWYKQFWPWFMLLPLASTVIVGIALVIIAFANEDSLVNDHYYREGLAINRSLDREKIAEALALHADLAVNPAKDEVHIVLSGRLTTWPQQLKLELLHPTNKKLDRRLLVTSEADNRYLGRWDSPIEMGQWYVQLSQSESGNWLLKMHCSIDKTTVRCQT